MSCPWCFAQFEPVNDAVFLNVDNYGGTVAIKAKCCGNIVCVQRKPGYTLFQSGKLTDDWGNKAKRIQADG